MNSSQVMFEMEKSTFGAVKPAFGEVSAAFSSALAIKEDQEVKKPTGNEHFFNHLIKANAVKKSGPSIDPSGLSQNVPASAGKLRSVVKNVILPSPEEPALGVSKGKKDEMYKVELGLLESSWREVDFSVEKALADSVTSYKPSCDSVSEAQVLLLGPIGAGKSSFISSVHSVFSGKVTNRAMVGTSSTSFTQKLQSFPIRRRGESGDQPTALVLCDAMGLGTGEMTGLTLHDILAVIKGHAPEGHNSDQALTAETVGYVKRPSAGEKIHCVAFVVDATKIDSYGKGMGFTFQQLREHISDLGVHQVALLTHVDQLCPETARDITKVYRSRLVQHTLGKAAALLGMSMSYVVPVKNYACELDVDENTNTLLLGAVQHILHYVELHFQSAVPPQMPKH